MTNPIRFSDLPLEILFCIVEVLDSACVNNNDFSIFNAMRVSRLFCDIVMAVHFKEDRSQGNMIGRKTMIKKMLDLEELNEWNSIYGSINPDETFVLKSVLGMGGFGWGNVNPRK